MRELVGEDVGELQRFGVLRDTSPFSDWLIQQARGELGPRSNHDENTIAVTPSHLILRILELVVSTAHLIYEMFR